MKQNKKVDLVVNAEEEEAATTLFHLGLPKREGTAAAFM